VSLFLRSCLYREGLRPDLPVLPALAAGGPTPCERTRPGTRFSETNSASTVRCDSVRAGLDELPA